MNFKIPYARLKFVDLLFPDRIDQTLSGKSRLSNTEHNDIYP